MLWILADAREMVVLMNEDGLRGEFGAVEQSRVEWSDCVVLCCTVRVCVCVVLLVTK